MCQLIGLPGAPLCPVLCHAEVCVCVCVCVCIGRCWEEGLGLPERMGAEFSGQSSQGRLPGGRI